VCEKAKESERERERHRERETHTYIYPQGLAELVEEDEAAPREEEEVVGLEQIPHQHARGVAGNCPRPERHRQL
jgi:hypothetical protein